MKQGLKGRLVTEAKTVVFLFVYLALLLSAFTTYRRLILAEHEINYLQYGASLFEALVLAKVITIGRFLRLGERFRDRALIIPVLYKTVCFSIFAIAFFALEHLVAGWWHGKTSTLVFQEMIDQGVWEILVKVLVLFMALAPLFAVWETGRALGEPNPFDLFFKRRAFDRSAKLARSSVLL